LDAWEGLTVRVRDGQTLGVVVGEFAHGPLAGRLRVQGDYASPRHKTGSLDSIAVYAIPREAVGHQLRTSLVLDTTLSAARSRWLMHVRTSARPIAMSGQGLLAPAMEWRSWS
jgi:hypothetical protein